MYISELKYPEIEMGRSIKDPRVTTGAGTALSAAKVAELTAASEAEAKRLVGTGGFPAAAIIVDVDKDGVKGTRWKLFGSIETGQRFKLSWLWGFGEDVKLWLQPGGLEKFEFGQYLEARNISKWIDARKECPSGLWEGDRQVDWAAAEQRFEQLKDGMSARLWLQVHKVGEVEVGLQVVPKSPDNLRRWAQEKNKDINSPLMPALSIWLGRVGGKPRKLAKVKMGLVEDRNDGYGLGHLPLFQVVGAVGDVVYPGQEELKREMFALQRGALIPSQRKWKTGEFILNQLEEEWEGASKYCDPRWPEGPRANPGGAVGKQSFLT